MPVLATRRMTADEFFRMETPLAGKYELVKGEVVHMPPPGIRHSKVQGKIYLYLSIFLMKNPLGQVFVEAGAFIERDPDTVRGPDVSYYSEERMPLDSDVIAYNELPPEWAIEVRSPHDRRRAVREKIEEYFDAGVRLVWIAEPEDRTITAYTSPTESKAFFSGDTITGGGVLPRFECLVSNFFS